jgi:hypothetical protein
MNFNHLFMLIRNIFFPHFLDYYYSIKNEDYFLLKFKKLNHRCISFKAKDHNLLIKNQIYINIHSINFLID